MPGLFPNPSATPEAFRPGDQVRWYVGDAHISPYVGTVTAIHPGIVKVDVEFPVGGNQRLSPEDLILVTRFVGEAVLDDEIGGYSGYDKSRSQEGYGTFDQNLRGMARMLASRKASEEGVPPARYLAERFAAEVVEPVAEDALECKRKGLTDAGAYQALYKKYASECSDVFLRNAVRKIYAAFSGRVFDPAVEEERERMSRYFLDPGKEIPPTYEQDVKTGLPVDGPSWMSGREAEYYPVIFEGLREFGWTVMTKRSPTSALETPYSISPDGKVKLWFTRNGILVGKNREPVSSAVLLAKNLDEINYDTRKLIGMVKGRSEKSPQISTSSYVKASTDVSMDRRYRNLLNKIKAKKTGQPVDQESYDQLLKFVLKNQQELNELITGGYGTEPVELLMLFLDARSPHIDSFVKSKGGQKLFETYQHVRDTQEAEHDIDPWLHDEQEVDVSKARGWTNSEMLHTEYGKHAASDARR